MTTNYRSTFIAVAPDCRATAAEAPSVGPRPTVASLQHALLSERPYELTSDELLFRVHVARAGIADDDLDAERERFFARDQACLRASPLPKRYGWGLHHDDEARVALVALGSARYDELVARTDLTQRTAMRSSRG